MATSLVPQVSHYFEYARILSLNSSCQDERLSIEKISMKHPFVSVALVSGVLLASAAPAQAAA
jgi:hypothetical protein